jgi:hypothetical protein
MASSSGDVPPELEAFGQLLDAQPANVRELFQYALTMLMVESRKARVLERHPTDIGECITICSVTGDTFTIARPNVGDDLLAEMMEVLREILAEDDAD